MSKKHKHYPKQKKPFSEAEADYVIYTDGGCAINPGGPGGYGAVIADQKTGKLTELSGAYLASTNNRMEIMAVVKALQAIPERSKAVIHMDSQYVLNTLLGVYSRSKNLDLWRQIDTARKGKELGFVWVRGHQGNQMNERCDELAGEAYTNGPWETDPGFGRSGPAVAESSGTVSSMGVQIEVPDIFDTAFDCGMMNAKEYAEAKGVHEECAKGILSFYRERKHAFRDYAGLKTKGVDSWSRKKEEDLMSLVPNGKEAAETAAEYFPDEKDKLTCLRWYGRGLLLKDAIRLVFAQREITANAIRSRY